MIASSKGHDMPDLITRAQSGCHAAQTELLAQFAPQLHALARQRSDGLTVADEEDFFQIASIEFLRATQRFDPARNVKFHTWIYGWVSKILLTHRADCAPIRIPKHIARDDPIRDPVACVLSLEMLTPDSKTYGEIIPDYRLTEETLDHEADLVRLRAAIAKLDRLSRAVVRARLNKVMFKTLAKRLKRSKHTLSPIHRRAVERLRALL